MFLWACCGGALGRPAVFFCLQRGDPIQGEALALHGLMVASCGSSKKGEAQRATERSCRELQKALHEENRCWDGDPHVFRKGSWPSTADAGCHGFEDPKTTACVLVFFVSGSYLHLQLNRQSIEYLYYLTYNYKPYNLPGCGSEIPSTPKNLLVKGKHVRPDRYRRYPHQKKQCDSFFAFPWGSAWSTVFSLV